MPDDPIFLKIKWANYHFLQLQKFFRTWVRSDSYSISTEEDRESHDVLYRLSANFAVPANFSLMAGDVVHNLRSALDHLACALVTANGGMITNQTGFPILDDVLTAPHEEKMFARKVKGMRADVVDVIRTIKPYKGGDDVLWRLHRLNNIDKHRLLFTVGAFLDDMGITQHIDVTNPPLDRLERMARAYASDEVWAEVRKSTFPLKAGDILWCDPPNTKVNEKIKFGIQIAINEPGVCNGEPLIVVLGTSISRVLQVVRRFAGMYVPEQPSTIDASNTKTLADRIAAFEGALTADQLAQVLSISAISVYKMAKSGRIPCVRIGASVRFCPVTVARWLRTCGG